MTTKYPKKIRILGKDYKVVYTRYLAGDTLATCYYAQGIIIVSTHTKQNDQFTTKKRCKDEIVESILHECLHAINVRLKLPYDVIIPCNAKSKLLHNKNIGLKEEQILRLTPAIQAIFKDNPELIKLLK